MSRQTICDLCAKVIDLSDGPSWHLAIKRTEMWHDVSMEMNFCTDCVTNVLYPKITKYMEEFHLVAIETNGK